MTVRDGFPQQRGWSGRSSELHRRLFAEPISSGQFH